MRIIVGLFATLTVVILGIYGFLFTSAGHGVLLPVIEGKIKDGAKLNSVEITKFDLSPSSLDTVIVVEDQPVKVNAAFSLFGKDLNLNYEVDIKDLSKFEHLSKQKLKGSFYTKGNVAGKFDNLNIKGDALLANGNITYDLKVADNNPKNINFTLKELDLPTLLDMVYQPKYINGKLNAKGGISSVDLENVVFNADVIKGSINKKTVEEMLKINLPKSDFKLNSDINIVNRAGKFNMDLDSSLITLFSKGTINIDTLALDSKYDFSVKSLSVLEKINGVKLNGSFATKGTVKGDKKEMVVDGFTDIASSKTNYKVVLKDLKPANISANIIDAKLDKLLHTVAQPKYTKGDLSSKIEISSLEPLKGNIVTTIKNGVLQHKAVKENFDIVLPKNPTFDLKADTNLKGDMVTTKVDLNSFAALLDTKKTTFNIASGKLQTDYQATVPDLSKLLFITKMPMRGDIKVNGNVTLDKTLLATFKAKKFSGDIDGKIDDTKLTVNTKGIKTLDLLHMIYYPEVFRSKLNLDLDYDTKTKKGVAKLDMANGKFLMSDSIKMINTVLGKDISLEVYEVADIDTVIDDTKLDSKLYFKSKNIELKSNKLFVDTSKQIIDANINTKYKKYSVDLIAKGDIKSPKVKVDAKNAVKQKAKEKVMDTIEKKLGDKVDDNIKGMFNNFFK